MKNTTLVYIERDHKYLMMYRGRKPDDPNAGKWIGVGGKIEEGETPDECAIRETREETGITLNSVAFRGIVFFINTKYETEYMYLYTSSDISMTAPDGTSLTSAEDIPLTDCDEGEFRWVDIDEVGSLHLWEGDRVFLNLLKSGSSPFLLTLRYDGDELLDHSLRMI
ncbi:MAG: 8-oxo-dGTP diphosphatase [Lachnospiraceae bacterium]|nr:8-oxo-dGTP diphosphatase [Lachnospiraceae bacterium]